LNKSDLDFMGLMQVFVDLSQSTLVHQGSLSMVPVDLTIGFIPPSIDQSCSGYERRKAKKAQGHTHALTPSFAFIIIGILLYLCTVDHADLLWA